MGLHLLKPMIQEVGYGRKKTARQKARRRRSKNTEERDKYYLWGRRRNGLTDNFTLTIYMQFLVAADTCADVLGIIVWDNIAHGGQIAYLSGYYRNKIWSR